MRAAIGGHPIALSESAYTVEHLARAASCSSPGRCYCRSCRPELFARRTDPATSRQAAARATDIAASHRNLIAVALATPATPKEIAERTGIEYHAVQRRLKEMTESPKLIEPTGVVRDGCREWRRA